jgi:hypothetical protein
MKNIHVFAAQLPSLTVLEETLNNEDGLFFTPLTDNQWSKLGLSNERQLTSLGNGYRIDFTYAGKDIPKTQIKEELESIVNGMDYEPSKDEIGELLESVTADFCAKMIVNTVKFSAFYHVKRGTLIFDCKESLAQSALGLLIKAIGSVETTTLHCSGISNSLTTNMLECLRPESEHLGVEFAGFTTGDLLVLQNQEKDVVRFKGDYPTDQVRELIEDGYEIKQINLSKDGVSFSLDDKFKIKGIKASLELDEYDFSDEEEMKLHGQTVELEIVTSHCDVLREFFNKQSDDAEAI